MCKASVQSRSRYLNVMKSCIGKVTTSTSPRMPGGNVPDKACHAFVAVFSEVSPARFS